MGSSYNFILVMRRIYFILVVKCTTTATAFMFRSYLSHLKRNVIWPCTKKSVPLTKFSSFSPLSRKEHDGSSLESLHNVSGIMCREVSVCLPTIGTVTILEATAQSQDLLVDMALTIDDQPTAENIALDNLRLEKGDIYGSVLWPAASALAQYLLTTVAKQTPLNSIRILELGTGTGLVSLAASMAGAKSVLATDYENIPLTILKHAMQVNYLKQGSSAGLGFEQMTDKLPNIKTEIFDICDHENPLPSADIVVAADIMYELKTGRALAHRVKEALSMGTRCIIACSPGRPGRQAFTEEIQVLLPNKNTNFIEIIGSTCSGPRNELICGKNSSSISEIPKALTVALLDIGPASG